MSQVNTNLMCPSGFGFNLQIRDSLESLLDLVKGLGLASRGIVGANGHFFSLVGMRANRCVYPVSISIWTGRDKGAIFFGDGAGFKLSRNFCVGSVRFRDQDDATRVTIQPVDDARSSRATHRTQLREMMRKGRRQSP